MALLLPLLPTYFCNSQFVGTSFFVTDEKYPSILHASSATCLFVVVCRPPHGTLWQVINTLVWVCVMIFRHMLYAWTVRLVYPLTAALTCAPQRAALMPSVGHANAGHMLSHAQHGACFQPPEEVDSTYIFAWRQDKVGVFDACSAIAVQPRLLSLRVCSSCI